MATDERTLNGYIALAIGQIAPPHFKADAEQHGTSLSGHFSPDIILKMPYGLRIIIETEYGSPAIEDAKRRIGFKFDDYSDRIRNVLAVGLPAWLGDCEPNEAITELARGTALLDVQVVTVKSNGDASTYPTGPHRATLRDLVQIAWLAAIPDQLTKRAEPGGAVGRT